MRLNGIHHVTAITADAQRNADFYTRALGLGLVKQTVNQDEPTVYHLFYSDEQATPGADLTFFEHPGAPHGRAGAGMVHRIIWRVATPDALDFWTDRLATEGIDSRRDGQHVRFADPEGLGHELAVVDVSDEPLIAHHPEIPAGLALQGFHAVRAYALDPDRTRTMLEDGLGFEPAGEGWEARGASSGGTYSYDPPPPERGAPGAGTVHHVAWASTDKEHEAWRDRVRAAGGDPTDVIDRFYFNAIYFREPSGVLFELATPTPGFTADEPLETLGEHLAPPPTLEPRRTDIAGALPPPPAPAPRAPTRLNG
jgi:glyoxalase family protein